MKKPIKKVKFYHRLPRIVKQKDGPPIECKAPKESSIPLNAIYNDFIDELRAEDIAKGLDPPPVAIRY